MDENPISAHPRTLRLVTRGDIENIYLHLAAFVQDPSAALHVEELIIDVGAWPECFHNLHDIEPIGPGAPSRQDAITNDLIREYIRGIGLSMDNTLRMAESLNWLFDRRGPLHQYAGTAAVLLLSLCKNVARLHAFGLEYLAYSAPFVMPFLLANNHGLLPNPSLQHLREVYVEACVPDDEREFDKAELVEHLRFFGQLPALARYSANAVMEYQARLTLFPPGSCSAALTSIHITNGDVSSAMLGTLIRAPRALQEFVYSAGGLSHFEGGTACVFPGTLGRCLREQRASLRVLDLDIQGSLSVPRSDEQRDMEDDSSSAALYLPGGRLHDKYFVLDLAKSNGKPLGFQELPLDEIPYGLTMGSLRDFDVLETLAVPIAALLGPAGEDANHGEAVPEPPFGLVDALPPGLRVLRLYDYERGESAMYDEHVDELMEKKAERFPALTEVVGVDEPLVVNSQYGPDSGYDEDDPPPQVKLRKQRFLDRVYR